MKTIEALRLARRQKSSGRPLFPSPRHDAPGEEQREEFLALFAHELMTPLTCILGWTQFAGSQLDSSTMAMALQVIERNARRQKALIDDLLKVLHYTRSSTLTFNPRHTDLWRQVEQAPPPVVSRRKRQLSLPLE